MSIKWDDNLTICEYWIGGYVPVVHVYTSSFVYVNLYTALCIY